MEMISVQSSAIAAMGFDAASQVLRVEFNSGTVYDYAGVPEDLFEAMMLKAPSHGQFFIQNVRNKFTFKKV